MYHQDYKLFAENFTSNLRDSSSETGNEILIVYQNLCTARVVENVLIKQKMKSQVVTKFP